MNDVEYEGPRRREYETNGLLSKLNHTYNKYRVLLTLIFIPATLFVVRWAWSMERRMSYMEAAAEILVRSKCADMTPEQIVVTGLNCRQILRRPVPEFAP
jgi:hypothetical protein